MALRDWLQLSLTPGIGPVLVRRLVQKAGDAAAACAASAALLRTIDGIGAAKAGKVAAGLASAASLVDDELRAAESANAKILCPEDRAYPLLLLEIPDPPTALYVRGDFQDRDLHSIAIVGSRKCSIYGREQADRFGALLAGAGMTVVSGGARGIDSAAHRAALQPVGGRTIAVLGCGVDVAYPPENEALFQQISQRGAVLSEYAMGTPPVAENFPRRNRLISGLARGVLVVEADIRSGALITARQAIDDHGRTVFALPGRVDNLMSAGPHQLIRDGATLVTSLEDIFAGLGPLPHSATTETLFDAAPPNLNSGTDRSPPLAANAALSAQQSLIVTAIGGNDLDTDTIIEITGLPAGVVMQELTLLTIKSVIRRSRDNRYSVRR